MFDQLGKNEKMIIGVVATLSLLVTCAAIIWHDDISERLFNSASDEGTSIGDSSISETGEQLPYTAEEKIANISVVDNDGTADIFISLTRASKITGAEIYFEVDGDTSELEIECTDAFICPDSDVAVESDSLAIFAFRPIDDASSELNGEVKVATLRYNASSPPTLSINTHAVEPILVTELGTSYNIAYQNIETFTLGL